MRAACSRLRYLLAGSVAALALAAPAAADLLYVRASTNYRPGVDFIVVRATVSEAGAVVGRGETTVFVGADALDLPVAEIELPVNRLYTLEVELVHQTGRPVARRRSLLEFRGPRVTTVLVAKPTGTATKRATLIDDRDGDERVSAGDLLRYIVVVDGDAARFADDPGPGLRLVDGSVTTSFGVVTRGNEERDSQVWVDGLQDATGPVTITFDCEVAPLLVNQGELHLADPSETSAVFYRLTIATDDPRTGAVGDPTTTGVACTGGPQCVEDLAICERDLGVCGQERKACEAARRKLEDQLATLLADPDRDGVAAVLDLCPATTKAAAVDDRGCSQAQFCGRIDLAQKQGEAICRRADWRGDEPLDTPRDCRPLAGACAAE